MNSNSRESRFAIGLFLAISLVTAFGFMIEQNPITPNLSELRTENYELNGGVVSAYTAHENITITHDDDFESQGFPGDGSPTNPYRIEGFEISSTYPCIYIEDTRVHFIIADCLLTGEIPDTNIGLNNVTNGVIQNNILEDHRMYGMIIGGCANNTITNNTFTGEYHGIWMIGGHNNTISSNIFSGDYFDGIWLDGTNDNILNSNTFLSTGISISGATEEFRHIITPDNTVNGKSLGYFWNLTSGSIDGVLFGQVILANCTGVTVENGMFSSTSIGMEIAYSSFCHLKNNEISNNEEGMYIYSSSNNIIIENTIGGNEYSGVSLTLSDNNTIANNTIFENQHYGVRVSQSSDNLIYCNIFSNNEPDNANDHFSINHWNTTGQGNYWSDYSGTGVYPILGSSGSIDYHPSLADIISPTINQPGDVNYEEESTGNTITWTPSDQHPLNYTIFRNGTSIQSEDWTGNSITIAIDGLSVGIYNYTIIVYDAYDNWSSDTVLVSVITEATSTTTDTTTDDNIPPIDKVMLFVLGIGGISIIIVIVFLSFGGTRDRFVDE